MRHIGALTMVGLFILGSGVVATKKSERRLASPILAAEAFRWSWWLVALTPAEDATGGNGAGEERLEVLSVASGTPVVKVPAGASAELELRVELKGEWHINAAQPADPLLIPTRLKLESAAGLTLAEPRYPAAKSLRFEFADEPLLVYAGKFVVQVPVQVAPDAAPGARKLVGKLRYQACDNERCLPPRDEKVVLAMEVVAAPGDASERSALTAAALPSPPSPPISTIPGGDAAATNAADEVAAGERNPELAPAKEEPSPRPSGGAVVAVTAGDRPADGLLSAGRVQQLISEGGYGVLFGLIFLVGLGLNLTPCVYPVIPITLGYFGNQSEQRPSKVFVLASLYVLGMAAMYSSLGVIAALTGKAFGSALQSPLVLVFEAAVMVALALSMFGLWEVGIPSFLANRLAASPTGYAGAVFMGLTVGIVAAPCIAPAVLGLFVFVGQTGSIPLGLAIFFVLALGLGTPFLLLAMASGSMSRLPRSGAWMVWVKHLFGFMLLAMALYFLRPVVGDRLFQIGIPLMAVVAGVFLGFFDRVGHQMATFRKVKATIGVLLLGIAAWSFIYLRPVSHTGGIQWHPYEPASFDRALKSGSPVLVDFTAEWCLPCKELDRFTFADAEVAVAASRFKAFRADGTRDDDEAVESLRSQFAVQGYPTILLIDSKGAERADLRVVGFVDASDFKTRLERID